MSYSRNVDLDALIDPNLTVTLKGKSRKVKPIDGKCYQLLTKAGEGQRSIDVMYEVAARCLPEMTTDEVLELTAVQVGAVVQLASGGVEEVEALASPNSEPAGKRGKSPTPS